MSSALDAEERDIYEESARGETRYFVGTVEKKVTHNGIVMRGYYTTTLENDEIPHPSSKFSNVTNGIRNGKPRSLAGLKGGSVTNFSPLLTNRELLLTNFFSSL